MQHKGEKKEIDESRENKEKKAVGFPFALMLDQIPPRFSRKNFLENLAADLHCSRVQEFKG